jgi:predicted nucleic acid-binding protein
VKKVVDRAFWDASAIVPLAIHQLATADAQSVQRTTGAMVVWWSTWVECESAFQRLLREGLTDGPGVVAAQRRVEALLLRATQVAPDESVRHRARLLLAAHPLRAADALQLAAAIEQARGFPRGHVFVCFDARLREAALAMGFDVRP